MTRQTMTLTDIAQFALQTVKDPAGTFARLRAMELASSTRWMVLVLSIGLSVILTWIGAMLMPAGNMIGAAGLLAQPLVLATAEFLGIVIATTLLTVVGRMFGGAGNFDDALLAFAWIQVVLLFLQAAQVLLLVLFPIVATLLGTASLGLFFYLLVSLTKAVHGFSNTLMVVLGIIGTALVSGFVLSMVMAALGLMPVPQAA